MRQYYMQSRRETCVLEQNQGITSHFHESDLHVQRWHDGHSPVRITWLSAALLKVCNKEVMHTAHLQRHCSAISLRTMIPVLCHMWRDSPCIVSRSYVAYGQADSFSDRGNKPSSKPAPYCSECHASHVQQCGITNCSSSSCVAHNLLYKDKNTKTAAE